MVPGVIGAEIDIDNVYIYLCDALRWSSLSDSMKSRGASFKTIASGCATMKAVSSIVSGVYPPNHGVHTWRDRTTRDTLFDLPEMSIGFHNPAAGEHGGLNRVLGQQDEDTLPDIDPPFFFFERDQGGHAPYRDYTYEEMITELTHDRPELRTYYEEAIEESIDRFDRRLEILSDRDLLADTLIIFLGDHGELLGEYGLVSHSSPIVPEMVYVPTVFVHPELPRGVQSETIGHVDIVPTVLSALGTTQSKAEFDGVDLFSEQPGFRYTEASHFQRFRNRRIPVFQAAGIWDGDGGHVFNQRGKLFSPIIGYLKAQGWNRAYWKANLREIPTALSRYSKPHIIYGAPEASKTTASNAVRRIQRSEPSAERIEIDETVEDRLEELGYRT